MEREHGVYQENGMVTIVGKGFEITFPEGCKDVSYDKEKGAIVLSNLSDDAIRQIEDELAARKR